MVFAKPLVITFRGTPVEGTRSIEAGFASDAIRAFIDATETVAASLTIAELKDRGPLPGAGKRTLRIVDKAVGSFGFELELPPDESAETLPLLKDISPPVDPYEKAIMSTLALVEEGSRRDEDSISDLVAEIHPRAAQKVRAFAKILSDSHALFAAEFEGRRVGLQSHDDVQRVLDALKEEDISEDTLVENGRLIGVLPESRKFECRLQDGSVLSGRLDRTIADAAEYKRQWDEKRARLTFRVVKVRSTARYTLVRADRIDDQLEDNDGDLKSP
jgi:hypothetical protein